MLRTGLQLIIWLALCREANLALQTVHSSRVAIRSGRKIEQSLKRDTPKSTRHSRAGVWDTASMYLRRGLQFAVQHFPRGEIPDVCRSWADDMAETDHRMGNHWTDIERNSLSSFLTCFRKALDTLSAPPRPESAYHPAALQHAADLDKAVKLFVSGAGFTLPALTQKLMTAVQRAECTGELECSSDQD